MEGPDREGRFLTLLRALSKPSLEQISALSAALGDSIQRVWNCVPGGQGIQTLLCQLGLATMCSVAGMNVLCPSQFPTFSEVRGWGPANREPRREDPSGMGRARGRSRERACFP